MKRLALVSLAALLAASCGGDRKSNGTGLTGAEASTRNQIRQTTRDRVQDGGAFTWAIDSMPVNWNYNQLDGSDVSSSNVFFAMLPTTFDGDAQGTPIWNRDYLASEPTVVIEPKQVVTYHINPKASWYDGTPITWEDFYWQ